MQHELMKTNKEPIYCGLAFSGISLDLETEIKPCCGIINSHFKKIPIVSENLDINNLGITDIRNSLMNGEWHPACQLCENAEKIGVESMRTIWNKTLKDAELKVNIKPEDVKWLSISVGNKCNSKCMTCGPVLSDTWIDEHIIIYFEHLFDNPKNTPEYIALNYNFNSKLLLNDTNIVEISNNFKNLEYLSFIGGEPTIIHEHEKLLMLLIEKNQSQHINLSYVTNLTNINEGLINIWKNFKNMSASLSVDGYSKVNEYIRYPIKFEKTQENLLKYIDLSKSDRFSINISLTVSLFNINHVIDLLTYITDIILEKNIPHNKVVIYLNRVTHPTHLNLNLLSTEYRNKNIEKIKSFKEKINNLNVDNSLLEACNLIESWSKEPQIISSDLLSKALFLIRRSDIYRKRHIKDFIPDLWEELLRMEKIYNDTMNDG